MTKLLLTFILAIISSSTFAQAIDQGTFEQLDQLIKDKEVAHAKAIIKDLTRGRKLIDIDQFKILGYQVWLSHLENKKKEEMEWMNRYVLLADIDTSFTYKKGVKLLDRDNDTCRIYINKSNYTKNLARLHQEERSYGEALFFLQLHESKYRFPHPCGNGHVWDKMQRKILFGEIHQGLENHEAVIDQLLPLSFQYAMGLGSEATFERKVDSLLLISLRTKYTKAEIIQEFEQVMKVIPEAKAMEFISGKDAIELFDTKFEIYAIYKNQFIEKRTLKTFQIKDEKERERVEAEIYERSYRRAFEENRIYQKVMK